MQLTRPGHPVWRMFLLPPVLALGSLPAAAQSGSEAVVCVGSENRIHEGNPIRRFYTEDMEVMYRIGVDIGQRSQIESTLGSELGPYPEVWCAWSDPGDDHVVIVGYTGVIRQDLTVDPEDPRFQAFSVGFGTDFDAAETQATTINQRFSSQSDGSGYEMLLRETWGVAEGALAEVSAPEPNLPAGPICTGRASSEGCWAEIANHPGCYLWNPGPLDGFSANWSGECSEGFAEGRGEVTWRWNDGSAIGSGLFQGGKREGFHVISWSNGERYEGSYVNDEQQGTWTFVWENGTRDVGPMVNGERHGNWRISFNGGSRGEGPYVNGEMHGTWTIFWEEGDVGREVGPYVNGERHGGCDRFLASPQWQGGWHETVSGGVGGGGARDVGGDHAQGLASFARRWSTPLVLLNCDEGESTSGARPVGRSPVRTCFPDRSSNPKRLLNQSSFIGGVLAMPGEVGNSTEAVNRHPDACRHSSRSRITDPSSPGRWALTWKLASVHSGAYDDSLDA